MKSRSQLSCCMKTDLGLSECKQLFHLFTFVAAIGHSHMRMKMNEEEGNKVKY